MIQEGSAGIGPKSMRASVATLLCRGCIFPGQSEVEACRVPGVELTSEHEAVGLNGDI